MTAVDRAFFGAFVEVVEAFTIVLPVSLVRDGGPRSWGRSPALRRWRS